MRIFALLLLLACSIKVFAWPNYNREREKALVALASLSVRYCDICDHVNTLKAEKDTAHARAGIEEEIKKNEKLREQAFEKFVRAHGLYNASCPTSKNLKAISKLVKET
ncbi:hypothetical protein HYX58_06170 [Candidatus Dependentiae bacterium]|nr:hypothetical protein [Candidatus Dependentiae bacterium]